MSRYSLKPRPEHSDIFEVAVGWDPGFDTFFVQVFGVVDEDQHSDMRCWHGERPGQIATVDELAALAAPYTEIPLELARRLANEQLALDAKRPRRLSRFILQLLNG